MCIRDSMSTGGHGVVSVASNIIGNQVKKLMGFILDGQTELLQKSIKDYYYSSMLYFGSPTQFQ